MFVVSFVHVACCFESNFEEERKLATKEQRNGVLPIIPNFFEAW
jgi:hypothetical protein